MMLSARQGCSQQKLETASLRRCWGQASLPRMVLHQAGGRLTKGSRWWTWHYCCNAVVTPRIRVPHLKVSLLLCGFGSCDACMHRVKLNPQIVKLLASVMVAAVFFRFGFLFACLFLDRVLLCGQGCPGLTTFLPQMQPQVCITMPCWFLSLFTLTGT